MCNKNINFAQTTYKDGTQPVACHNDIGKKGEDIAVEYLTSKGYSICERNWRSGKKEIDIIAMDSLEVVIVEVKTRTSTEYGDPEEFVKPAKIRNIAQAADAYLSRLPHAVDVRFDIISVVIPQNQSGKYQIEHIKDAFYPYTQNFIRYGY